MNPFRCLLVCCSFDLLTGCAPLPVQETPRITGVVINAKTQLPVPGTNVSYESFPQAAAVTSERGEFEIDAVKRWQVVVLGTDHKPIQLLNVAAQGYKAKQVVVYLGGVTEYSIHLEPIAMQAPNPSFNGTPCGAR